ncbi:hypothetical protein LR010_03275 [Candidatus Gracilibacteria bacterium]|nr:hypothetical protein [Candidatus Gracilibacteria bacterium]
MVISDEYTLLKTIRNSLSHDNGEDVLIGAKDFDDCALIKIDDYLG